MADVHVLLVYGLDEQRLLTHTEFAADERDDAFSAYAAAEAEHRDLDDVEIVLVAADSLATIRHTHGSYFRESVGIMDLALDGLLARS
ncbi:MAG: hypothetical protein QGD91_10865 [Actinomycetota bacterium]|nr:hypothetical protein [Actinomycetota bacterium]MDK1039399.1 hypothetical protein [Actinomycetota bacterium]MDK1103363.1 hypothetical protein [Actinomycetota bacterium]